VARVHVTPLTSKTTDSRPQYGRAVLAVVQIAGFIALIVLVLTQRDAIDVLRRALEGWGTLGVLAFIAVHVLWTLTTLPTMPLMVVAGLVFGVWKGTLYVMIGGVLGSAAVFGLGRFWFGGRAGKAVRRRAFVARAIELVEAHPIASVVIVKSAPVFPLNMLIYGFGATRMSFRLYLALTVLVLLPGAALYTGLGSVLRRAAEGGGLQPAELVWLLGFVALAGTLAWYAKRHAND
jgi:uncharacterized membrane protein YdjX (TVP38/TMEM64 family)